MRPGALVGTAAAAFAGVFGLSAILRHRSFESGRFDLGNMTQAVWSTAHGDVLSVTDVQGEQISRLGAHFDPILVALAPLWWLWPSPELLLVVQALAVAAGAPAVWRLAAKHLGPGWPAAALAVAYLLLPPVQWLVLSDFHPVALATPLLLWAWWFLDERRLLPFALCAAAALATKEHVGLVVAMMGGWYAIRYRAVRPGASIAVAGGLAALLAALVVVPHFAPTGTSAFASRYDDPGLGGRDVHYLLSLLLPLALVPLAAPLALVAALPELGLNLLSSTVTQTSVRTHYAAATVPALLAAAVYGTRRLGAGTSFAVLGAAAAGCLVLGPLGRVELRADTHDAAARRALSVVPAEVPVSATNSLGAHLSERRRIFSFPVLGEARWVAVDTTRLTFLDSSRGERSLTALGELDRQGWVRVFAEDGVVVLRR